MSGCCGVKVNKFCKFIGVHFLASCRYCEKTFADWKKLRKHVKKNHSVVSNSGRTTPTSNSNVKNSPEAEANVDNVPPVKCSASEGVPFPKTEIDSCTPKTHRESQLASKRKMSEAISSACNENNDEDEDKKFTFKRETLRRPQEDAVFNSLSTSHQHPVTNPSKIEVVKMGGKTYIAMGRTSASTSSSSSTKCIFLSTLSVVSVVSTQDDNPAKSDETNQFESTSISQTPNSASSIGEAVVNDSDQYDMQDDEEYTRQIPAPREGYRLCQDCYTNIKYPKYGQKSAWVRHREIHTGARQFACHFCWMGFKDPIGLMSHVNKQHTGSKDFECEACKRSFLTKQGLNCHGRMNKECKSKLGLKGRNLN